MTRNRVVAYTIIGILVALTATMIRADDFAEKLGKNLADTGERRVDPAVAAAKAAEEAKVQAQLDRRLPEVNFNGNDFSDIVDFLRDVTGANIFVNWRSLEASGIKRNVAVTARLKDVKFSKALQVVLDDAAGAPGKLAFIIDEGVITISTVADLRQNTATRTYDVRFLINNKGKLEGANREKRVAAIVKMITGSVDPSSWRENGGSTGMVKELSGQLIVTQVAENQKAIENLIEQLKVVMEAEK